MKPDNTAVIIQSRTSSARFPEKMLQQLAGMPLVEYVHRRCSKSSLTKVIVATSDDPSDDLLDEHCRKAGIFVIRGSLDNVLGRFIQVADSVGANYVVRVCGDTPFVDISLFEELNRLAVAERLDYAAYDRMTCAAGFYSEVVSVSALKKISQLTHAKEDLEHVTKFILDNKNSFNTRFIEADLNPESIKDIRLTIDFPLDLERANNIVKELKDPLDFSSRDIIAVVSLKGARQCL